MCIRDSAGRLHRQGAEVAKNLRWQEPSTALDKLGHGGGRGSDRVHRLIGLGPDSSSTFNVAVLRRGIKRILALSAAWRFVSSQKRFSDC